MKPALFITNRFDPHVDFMVEKFNKRGLPFIRFNSDDYPLETSISTSYDGEAVESRLMAHHQVFRESEIGAIWIRRPDTFAVDSAITDPEAKVFAEEEIGEYVQGWWHSLSNHKWVSNPLNIRRASYKVPQMKAARDLGFVIPKTLITTDREEFISFWNECSGEVVYKTMGSGVSKDEAGKFYFSYTAKLTPEFLERLDDVATAPCLFQKYIPKKLELRINVVENQAFACAIYSQQSERSRVDWRRYDFENTPHTPWVLPAALETSCVQLVKKLGLRFGAIDMILTPWGEYVFLEINPNGQWLWIEQLTGLPISDALMKSLTYSKRSW